MQQRQFSAIEGMRARGSVLLLRPEVAREGWPSVKKDLTFRSGIGHTMMFVRMLRRDTGLFGQM